MLFNAELQKQEGKRVDIQFTIIGHPPILGRCPSTKK